jgi:DNA-binding transcriptional MerR regulator
MGRKMTVDEITSTQIISALDDISARTLRRWRKLELIPPPTVRNLTEGRGRISYWPAWVLDRCVEIRHLLQKGHSLAEIQKLLPSQIPTPQTRRHKYRFRDIVLERDVQLELLKHQRLLARALRKASRRYREINPVELLTRQQLLEAKDLQKKGFDSFFVVSDSETVVIPDFVLSHYLSQDHSQIPLIVIPFLRATAPQPIDPAKVTQAAKTIVHSVDGTVRKSTFQYHHPWKYEMDSGHSATSAESTG